MNLSTPLHAYFDEMESNFLKKKMTFPRLAWACGEEMLAAPIHLAFNASAYIFIGQFIQKMNLRPTRILDLGCGTGGDTNYLQKNFASSSSVIGVDKDSSLVKFASETYGGDKLHFETADACNLPFADESFDMVTAVFSIVHTMSHDESTACMKEISRVLKPGGILIFSTPNRRMSQDHYHLNPIDKPELMFSPLLRHEYRRENLVELLAPFVGTNRLFSTLNLGSLSNIAFRPVWQETIQELARRRFGSGLAGRIRSWLVRRLLPAPYLAHCYFRLIQKTCARLNVKLIDIVENARYHEESENIEADHFIVIAHK